MKKAIEAKFYKSLNGFMSVKNWLKALPKMSRKIIGEDIQTVEMGWLIGMLVARSLGKKLWEVRSDLPNGTARIIFVIIENPMILLHGFIKKT